MLNLKKIMMVALLVALASPIYASEALANKKNTGGFTGLRPEITSVVDAQKMPDNSWTTLRGYIVRYNGDEKYLFKDSTGEQIIEIDNDIWRGQNISPDDLVEIVVEIDKDFRRVEFEAEEIRIVQQ